MSAFELKAKAPATAGAFRRGEVGLGELCRDRDGRLLEHALADRLHRLFEARGDLGLAEEADDLDRLVADVDEPVGHHRRDHGEVARADDADLVAHVGLGRAGHDVKDLLGAVGVHGQALAGLHLEVDDGAALRAGRFVEREVHRHASGRIVVPPDLHEIDGGRLGCEHCGSVGSTAVYYEIRPYRSARDLSRIGSTLLYDEYMSRKYEQRKRAEAVEDTRRRITEAAVELHGS